MRKWLIILAVLAVVLGGAFFYMRSELLQSEAGGEDITDLDAMYEASEEIKAAQQKLSEGGLEPAEVVTTLQDGSKKIAIVFDGLPNRPDTARIVDSLKKHDAAAVFFAEGQNAADQPETVKIIKDAGIEMGNYTFVGMASFQKVPQDAQISSICRTQKVLNGLTGITPALFRAPHTDYTDPLLIVLRACGIGHAVKSNASLKRGSLHTDAEADAFVATLKPGSILSVMTNSPVYALAMDTGKTNQTPAEDKKPNITDEKPLPEIQPAPLPEEVELLLAALERAGWKMEPVGGFRSIRFVPAATEAQ